MRYNCCLCAHFYMCMCVLGTQIHNSLTHSHTHSHTQLTHTHNSLTHSHTHYSTLIASAHSLCTPTFRNGVLCRTLLATTSCFALEKQRLVSQHTRRECCFMISLILHRPSDRCGARGCTLYLSWCLLLFQLLFQLLFKLLLLLFHFFSPKTIVPVACSPGRNLVFRRLFPSIKLGIAHALGCERAPSLFASTHKIPATRALSCVLAPTQPRSP